MATPPIKSLRLEVAREGAAAVATILCENVTQFDVTPLEAELIAAAQTASWRIVVDMSKVQLLGSAGLGLFITLRKQVDLNRGALALTGISEEIMGILRVTKLHTLLPIAKDRAAALDLVSKR
jgi:anti-anti-sigma factor